MKTDQIISKSLNSFINFKNLTMKKFIPFFLFLGVLLVFISAKYTPDSKSLNNESSSAEKIDFKLYLVNDCPLHWS